MKIRILEPKDVSNYKDLRLSGLLESPFAFSESFEDESQKTNSAFENELEIIGSPPESFVLGLFSDLEELIGFVRFKRDLRSKARHKASLHALYIKAEHRSEGLGKKLIHELFKTIELVNGLEQIHLWALISDHSVVRFYEKFGFESQGTLVKNDLKIQGKYVDACYMVKTL